MRFCSDVRTFVGRKQRSSEINGRLLDETEVDTAKIMFVLTSSLTSFLRTGGHGDGDNLLVLFDVQLGERRET